MSNTLGIDLSAQPKGTAACRIAWDASGGRVEDLIVGADDDSLTHLRSGVAITAVDCPFGWPVAFVSAVAGWRSGSPWPGDSSNDLRHRFTDRWIRSNWEKIKARLLDVHDAYKLLNRAEDAYKNGNLETAWLALDHATTLAPHDQNILFAHAVLRLHDGDP